MLYLQKVNAGYCGNSPMWWSTEGGYTPRLEFAKRFTVEEVDAILRTTSRATHEWKAWDADAIDRLSHREVDVQDMHKLKPVRTLLDDEAA
jgi:hypothetical protein